MRKIFASWFGPIDTKNATAVIHDLARGWYFVAGLQAVFQMILIWLDQGTISNLLDAAICVLGGYFLDRRRSRTVAVVLLFFALATLSMTVAAMAGQVSGGRNILLALIVVGMAIRGVQATWFYQASIGTRIAWKNLALAIVTTFVASIVLFMLMMIAAALADLETENEDLLGSIFGLALVLSFLLVMVPLTRKRPLGTIR